MVVGKLWLALTINRIKFYKGARPHEGCMQGMAGFVASKCASEMCPSHSVLLVAAYPGQMGKLVPLSLQNHGEYFALKIRIVNGAPIFIR